MQKPTRHRRRRAITRRAVLPAAVVVGMAAALVPGLGSARALSPPSNTGEPRIIGDPVEGRTLTATTGSWSGTGPFSYSYRWVRCPLDGGAPDGSNCGALPNSSTSTYRLRDADVGLRMRVRVTATNSEGSTTVASNATTPVRGSSRPRNVDPPTISGQPVLGQTLTATTGTWSGSQPISYAYDWLRCNRSGGGCAVVSGATGRSYALRQDDVGTTLRIRVTARNSIGSERSTSVPTAVVVSGAPTGCPAGGGPVPVEQVTPPARLLVDRFQVSPSPVPLGVDSLVVRFHVSACGGRSVAGALVYATAVPYNQFAIPAEQHTAPDGWVTLQMQRLNGFPAAARQTLLVMFVRARKGGEPVLSGISTRRLISFRLAR